MQQLAEQLFGKIKDKTEAKQMLSELYKYGIEAMLKAELDEHLQHEKHDESPDGNYRNGSSKKTVKSSIGDLALNIPMRFYPGSATGMSSPHSSNTRLKSEK